jgi:hypothetical protein
MSKARFVAITWWSPADTEQTATSIKRLVSQALDWYRPVPNCFVIRTALSNEDWASAVTELIGTSATVIVQDCNPSTMAGVAPMAFWEFMGRTDATKLT